MKFQEICDNCFIGFMEHTMLYTWECSYCGFSYRIDPSGQEPKITILHRGKIPKLRIYSLDTGKNNQKGVRC